MFPQTLVCKLASYFTNEIERQINISKESTEPVKCNNNYLLFQVKGLY